MQRKCLHKVIVGETFFLSLVEGEDNLLHVRWYPSERERDSDTHKVIQQVLSYAGGIDNSLNLQSIKIFFRANAGAEQNSRRAIGALTLSVIRRDNLLISCQELTRGKDDFLGGFDITLRSAFVNQGNTGRMRASILFDKVDLVNQRFDDNVNIAPVVIICHKIGACGPDPFVVGSWDVSATMRRFTGAEHIRN